MTEQKLQVVSDKDELRTILGPLSRRNITKERIRLHTIDRDWIAATPFVFVATSDADGRCDVSPKGDPAGFIHVVDDQTIVIPERPGNRRADGFHNVLDNPNVGLIFVIPGRGDTLRVNGKAKVIRDALCFDAMVVNSHRPQLALWVEIEQIFFHCSKAFMRSEFWDSESWTPQHMPTRAEIVDGLKQSGLTLEQLQEHYGEKYRDGLY